MSYCRWSSDDYRCDLYCYASSSGYETYVAGRRVPDNTPREIPFPDPYEGPYAETTLAWMASHRTMMDFLRTCERVDIDLPHAGAHFCDIGLAEFRDTLLRLRELGYRFPDYVLEDVDAEIAEEATA